MKRFLSLLAILAALTLSFGAISVPVRAAAHVQFGPTTRAAAQCAAQGAYPDSGCTPGAIFSDVTANDVCTPGYSSSVRNVPASVKNRVYAEYGIATHSPGQYEVDHFIPLELGGSNDISNLWPEAANPRPGFHEKDTVENYLHDQVCSGAMSLSDAQNAITGDWVAVYNQI